SYGEFALTAGGLTVGRLVVHGNAGNDSLTVRDDLGGLPAFLYGDVGDDLLRAGVGNSYLDGGAGNDSLLGGTGNAVLLGGCGDDLLVGGDGRNVLIGGAGVDRLV